MKYTLPLILIIFVLLITPLYPIYAASPAASSSARPSGPGKAVEQLLQKRDAKLDKLDEKRDKILDKFEEQKARLASRSAALKLKLNKFKDKIKAQRVERINTNLPMINERRTDTMSAHLVKMEEILTKLEARVKENAGTTDISAITAAIADAKSKIAAAKAAVDLQMDKDYGVELNTETTVKEDAKAARESLHKDLKSVHDLVVEARKAVAEAISTAVSTLKGSNNGQ